MATKKAQRIGIWIIAIALTVGTLTGFVAIILQPQNEANDQARITALTAEYQTNQDEYQKKVAAQATTLSATYFSQFEQYASRVKSFDKASVTDLKTEDLKVGDGAEITADTTFSAYYIGWGPDGVIFDQSIIEKSLKTPIDVAPGSVIKGWTEGAVGMKIGGVRELTIPADKAYGENGAGDTIAPNTPLKFVIMIIPTPELIAQPEVPAELLKYYSKGTL